MPRGGGAAAGRGELETVAGALERAGGMPVAILFLHSYRNPDTRSARATFSAAAFRAYSYGVARLSQEYREFERTSTVAGHAYIGPHCATVLGRDQPFSNGRRFPEIPAVHRTATYDSDRRGANASGCWNRDPRRRDRTRRAVSTIALETRSPSTWRHDGQGGRHSHGSELSCRSWWRYCDGLPIQIPMIDIEVSDRWRQHPRGGDRRRHAGPPKRGASAGRYGNGGTERRLRTPNSARELTARSVPRRRKMQLDIAAARKAVPSASRVRSSSTWSRRPTASCALP